VPASYQPFRLSPQPIGNESYDNILLLEEYDALAVAIGSALKKFAPQHTVSVARSLTDAEKLAAEGNPKLFVIDVDPPWLGLADFLDKMRTARPEARVLIIGAPIPPEIAAHRGSFGALQFIGKPFELAAFGAAVQAVLGPWRATESATPRGSLRDLNAVDMVLLHCAATSNAVLEFHANSKRSGKIHITEGGISHAVTGALTGTEALREILSWPNARMIAAKPLVSAQRTIDRSWVSAFVEVLRETGPKQPPRISPVDEPQPQKQKTGKKIVVIDDTEMLLIFVEDVLTTADPELQITTALTGIQGVEEVERVLPDLVLLDYSLPDVNGDEVCKRLLRNERTSPVPILMMSGHVAEMAATAKRFENVVATIEKPFLSDALVQLVQNILSGKAQAPHIVPRTVAAAEGKPVAISQPAAEPLKGQERSAEKKEPTIAAPLSPAMFETPPEKAAARPIVRVITDKANDALLGLFFEVISMQLTPRLQMGPIRARPASLTVSLQLASAARDAVGGELGFQLGATDLDQNGSIASLRLIPTARPFRPTQTRSAFQIGGVAVIPNDTRTKVQLTPAGTTPMTMQLLAHLELDAVELSTSFQVAQVILKWRTNAVGVTLSSKTGEQDSALYEVKSVKLDASSRIAELLLTPCR
jgi:DNA-binding response OmpR family regulator